MIYPLNPSIQLLIKLGSLIVHYQEFSSKDGHPYDKEAIGSLEKDPEVIEWLEQMDKMAFLPKKRN